MLRLYWTRMGTLLRLGVAAGLLGLGLAVHLMAFVVVGALLVAASAAQAARVLLRRSRNR